MTRAPLARLTVLALLVGARPFGPCVSQAASLTGKSALSADERATLLKYAKDTWHSFLELSCESGLPADSLTRTGKGWSRPLTHTSPSNIGAYLWSILAAERLHLIDPVEARSRIDRTLATLAAMKRTHGFFVNELDPRTGSILPTATAGAGQRRLRVSCVDNAWLAVALTMIGNVEPVFRSRVGKLMEPMDFRFFYDPYGPADPVHHPGQLHVGYRPDDGVFYGHYGMLNTEARIAAYLGISRGQLPPEIYYRMFRTLPANLGPQEQSPRGESREYCGVKVFEGSYDYRGIRIVPSWGGSMFEALMVTLFVPEDRWAPRSWGVNHPLYVRAQIEHGVREAGYGYWGFSPAADPRGGYAVYGVDSIGTWSKGYSSYEVDPSPPEHPTSGKTHFTHGVVAPYASFLALRYVPHEAIAHLQGLSKTFPIYSPLGFYDSVDVSAGVVSGCILAIDQGMIMAAIANAVADDVMQHAFGDGPVERTIRPLIEAEEFFAGQPAPTAKLLAATRDAQGRETGAGTTSLAVARGSVTPGSGAIASRPPRP
jgi:hypothetical protein